MICKVTLNGPDPSLPSPSQVYSGLSYIPRHPKFCTLFHTYYKMRNQEANLSSYNVSSVLYLQSLTLGHLTKENCLRGQYLSLKSRQKGWILSSESKIYKWHKNFSDWWEKTCTSHTVIGSAILLSPTENEESCWKWRMKDLVICKGLFWRPQRCLMT